ncbi:hypothetical protein A2U01_0113662, partial [Trifolium medium]|nr:hypothetical protein [Trifolium medium]
ARVRVCRSTWGSSWVFDPSRTIGLLYRAGSFARCTEQEHWLVIPSRIIGS